MKTFLRWVIIFILGIGFLSLEIYVIGAYDSWMSAFAYLGAVSCFVVLFIALIWALIDDEPEKETVDG